MQGAALRSHELREILFSVNGKCGYLLDNALKQQYTGLDGMDDRVFDNPEPTVNIRLEVRPPQRRDPVVVLTLPRSGCRIRDGELRLVLTPSFICVGY